MNGILCIYYSRTGHTRRAMKQVAQALDAELIELTDGVERLGWKGALRCGMDAVRNSTDPIVPCKTQRPLSEYRLVILGTPVWAGRCSSVLRGFLKERGGEIQRAAYVLTRSSEETYREIYGQLDGYLPCGHCAAVSLRLPSAEYSFWMEEFLHQVRENLALWPG